MSGKLVRWGAAGLFVLCSCKEGRVSEQSARAEGAPGGVARVQQAVGEVRAGYPNDFERMVHVLTNQARHSPTTPNNNQCGDWTQEVGANVKKVPLVWEHQAGVAARFMSRHLSEVGCFQHNSCCQLGDAGLGSIQCVGAGACTGTGCNKVCDAGVGSSPVDRHQLFGFGSFAGENLAQAQSTPFDAWCAWMQSQSHRQNIYGQFTQLGVGAYSAQGQTCNGWYWSQSFGNAPVTVPRIPAASAIYDPPHPNSTLQFYFASNYYDPSGQGPKRSFVVVNGHCFDLEKKWGHDDNGTYETRFPDPDLLPEGCHPYYFLFFDSNLGRHVYPDTGSLNVAIGQTQSCPLSYDPSPQKPADCETGQPQCPTGASQKCYTADPVTLRYGECRQGYQVCKNGFWSACREMIGPFPEVCDGLDNDCDGETDEGNPGGGGSCEVPQERGECRQNGVRQCTAGRFLCLPTVNPQPELCDGKDNDCDGLVDDGFQALACGKGECFRMVPGCSDGQLGVCTPGTPSVELPDGKDNDCNGWIDDGIDCTSADGGGVGRIRRCFTPALLTPDGGFLNPSLPCRTGTQTCQADAGWTICQNEVTPQPEVCDGEDNDCDTDYDELAEIGWERCGSGACTVFTPKCRGGVLETCTPKQVRSEVCNGYDDNCDGTVDEGCACREGDVHGCYTGPPGSRDAGVCHPGQRLCIDGGFTRCLNEVVPSSEVCNQLDDNCDGEIDNLCVAPPHDGGTDAGSGESDGGDGSGDGGSGQPPPKKGCGCGSSGLTSAGALGLVLGLLRRRR